MSIEFSPTNTAIVLIGFQNDYFRAEGALNSLVDSTGNAQRVMKNTIDLLDRALVHKMLVVNTPILFSNNYDELVNPCGVMQLIKDKGAFKRNSPGGQVCREIGARREIVHLEGKTGFNAFVGTGLNNYLSERGIYNVVLCGVVTSICVDSTGRAATEKGFNTTILDNCTGARSAEEQDFYMKEICPLYSTVCNSSDLFSEKYIGSKVA